MRGVPSESMLSKMKRISLLLKQMSSPEANSIWPHLRGGGEIPRLGEVVQYTSLVSYLPILVGGLFSDAVYLSNADYTKIDSDRLMGIVDRIGTACRSDTCKIMLRWKSAEAALDEGPNFERISFVSMLQYHLSARKVESPVAISLNVENRITERKQRSDNPFRFLKSYELATGIKVSGSDGNESVEGTEQTSVLITPRMALTGSNTDSSIIRRYEYAPMLVYETTEDVDHAPDLAAGSVNSERLYLRIDIQFVFSNAWDVRARLRISISSSDLARMKKSIFSVLGACGANSGVITSGSGSPSSVLELVNSLASHSVDQYCFDLVYTGQSGSLYTHLEEALIPVLRTGKRAKTKENNFYQVNHIALAWEYLHPYIENFDRRLAIRLNESFLQGDFFLGALFPSMRTASNAILADVYKHLEDRPFYYTAKLNGEQSKLFITIEKDVGNDESYRLSFFEALSLSGNMRRWKIDSSTLKELHEAKMSHEKKLLFVFDAEFIKDTFQVFRALVVANENYLGRSETESWNAINSEVVSIIFRFLRANGTIVQFNMPVVLTQKNFADLCMMSNEEIGGFPTDGLVLALTSAVYFNTQRDDPRQTRLKLKPANHNTLDLLLKRVSPEMLTPHNIRLPKGTLASYIAYTTGNTGIVLSTPIPKLRLGIWRKKHFPSLVNFERTSIPCEFMTTILPTSHIAIVTDPSMPDFDDKIAECLLQDGWIRPLFEREAKTASYRSGVHVYGNGYKAAMMMMPSILDPITPESIKGIQQNPEKYYEPSKDIVDASYKDFLLGVSVGKAIAYGKYLALSLNPKKDEKQQHPPLKSRHSVAPHTLIEIGCGKGSDIPRAFCAGARTVFAIDPDVHTLLQYESKASGLSSVYGSGAFASQNRKRLAIQQPIVYPTSTFNIPQIPVWSLRTIIGKITEEERDSENIIESLAIDSAFPSTGVAAIAAHFVLQSIVGGPLSLSRIKGFCDKVLGTLGIVSFVYYDGQRIYDLLTSPVSPRPWIKIEANGRTAIEIDRADKAPERYKKFFIEKKWQDEAPGKLVGFGKKVSVLLQTLSADTEDEYLIDPTRLVGAFVPDYQILYDGPMIDEYSYFEAIKESGAITISKGLQDCFKAEDFQYLSLIRMTILEKAPPGGKRASQHSAAQMFTQYISGAASQ